MYYTFTQNNSGGGHTDPACYVIVEADSAKEANERAKTVGVYFDEEYEIDCECCGTRWYEQWDDKDGEKEPMIYGTPVAEYVKNEAKSYFRRDALVVYSNGVTLHYGEKKGN